MSTNLSNSVVAFERSAIRPLLSRLVKNIPLDPPLLSSQPLTFVERLESRQMLSTITHPIYSDVTVEGEFHTINSTSSVADRTFNDNNGNKVTFNLVGGGSLVLFQADNGEILTLDVDGAASGKTALHILVNSNGHKGTGYTTIADIDVDADGLSFFNASKVNVSHHFMSAGVVRNVSLGDIGGPVQANFTIGGTHSDNILINLGALDDVSFRTSASITAFRAQDWQDNNDTRDYLEASSLKLLFVTGRNETKYKGDVIYDALPGDFDTDLHLTYVVPVGTSPTSPLAKPMVNVVQIKGNSTGDWDLGAHKLNVTTIRGGVTGDWTANGGINLITVMGSASSFNIHTTHGINMVKLGEVANSSIDADGKINAVAVLEWIGGSINAGSLNVLTTFGRGAVKGHTKAVSGDFAADILITGEGVNKANAVGRIAIKGNATGDGTYNGIGDDDWIIAGSVGFIVVGGNMTNLNIDIRAKGDNPGNLGAFWVTGMVTNTDLEVAGKLGMVRIQSSNGLDIHVGGSMGAFFAGNLVDTSLDVGGSIGSIQVTGWNSGSIDADKIANFHVRSRHGNKFVAAGSGDINALAIHLSGEGIKAGQLAMGPVQIDGRVDNSTWRILGNTGPVSVGAFMNSALFVGVNDAASATTLPGSADFLLFDGKTASLLNFTVTGKAVGNNDVSFDSSRVAAGTLVNVSLKLVNGASEASNGMVAASRIGNYSRLDSFPRDYVRVMNKTAPGTYDTEGTYVLKIV